MQPDLFQNVEIYSKKEAYLFQRALSAQVLDCPSSAQMPESTSRALRVLKGSLG